MFKWLWHTIIYGAYPTRFDKRAHERYLEGIRDGKNADVRLDQTIRLFNAMIGIHKRQLQGIRRQLEKDCITLVSTTETELLAQMRDKIVGKSEEMLVSLYQRELESHEKAAKEGTYNGAEQALKHAVDQILAVMDPKVLAKLAMEKENG